MRRLRWEEWQCAGITGDVAASAELMECQAGQVIIELDLEINRVYTSWGEVFC